MTEEINYKKLIFAIAIMTILLLFIPFLSWKFYGKFTWDITNAFEEYEKNNLIREQEEFYEFSKRCEFYASQDKYGWSCERPCLENSLDGKNCVRKGCVDSGFLGLGLDCDWYVCEGYGDIKQQCINYYDRTKEEYCSDKNKSEEYWCYGF